MSDTLKKHVERLILERDEALKRASDIMIALGRAEGQRDTERWIRKKVETERDEERAKREKAERKLYEAQVAGARVTEAYKALRVKKPLGHEDATVESYDVADWPYPPDWDAQKEWVESLKAEIERLTRERDEERTKREEAERYAQYLEKAFECEKCDKSLLIPKDSPDTEYAGMPLPCFCGGCWGKEIEKRREAEVAQAAMVKIIEPWVCKSLREDGPIACNTCGAVIEECRFQLATHALANLTPGAARMVRIKKAAEERYGSGCPRVEGDGCGYEECDACVDAMVCKAVRGEGEKP
jgi:ssDNA-binding Zn-finger/Zn-ribbon topoisomerase 1